MLKFQTIIFIGPQGSGKGTQAQLLSAKISAEYLEMGYLLRQVSKTGTLFGDKVKKIIDSGDLIPDDMLMNIINEKISGLNPDLPVIFDGVPRKLGQAKFLIEDLKGLHRGDAATIYIKIPRQTSIDRLMTRLVCQNCKSPKPYTGSSEEDCARCGGVMVRRADDSDTEIIKRRLDNYEKETLPVIDYLKEVTTLFEIDGTPSIKDVEKQIDNCLEIAHV